MFQTFFVVLLEVINIWSPSLKDETPKPSHAPSQATMVTKNSEMVMIKPSKELTTQQRSPISCGKMERIQRICTSEMSNGNFNKHFEVLGHIRSGRFGDIFSVMFKQTKEKAVAKILPRRSDQIPDEIEWMKTFKHQNIVEYIMSTANRNYVQIIMATHGLMTFGLDVYVDRMRELDGLDEQIVKLISFQITNGLFYLHEEMSAVHLDLKLDNIVINEELKVRIIDFGNCCEAVNPYKRHEKPYYGAVGTPNYMCPEMLNDDQAYYGREADIWSFGIMIYLMITGYFPFKIINENITLSENALYPTIRKNVSSDVKILLNGMLERDGAMRISVKQMQYQAWFEGVQNIISIPDKYYIPFKGDGGI